MNGKDMGGIIYALISPGIHALLLVACEPGWARWPRPLQPAAAVLPPQPWLQLQLSLGHVQPPL